MVDPVGEDRIDDDEAAASLDEVATVDELAAGVLGGADGQVQHVCRRAKIEPPEASARSTVRSPACKPEYRRS